LTLGVEDTKLSNFPLKMSWHFESSKICSRPHLASRVSQG
jgi:hypothetical protein